MSIVVTTPLFSVPAIAFALTGIAQNLQRSSSLDAPDDCAEHLTERLRGPQLQTSTCNCRELVAVPS